MANLTKVAVVVGILKRGDRFLIAERPLGKPYSGYWEFPGGKLEVGETPLAALSRELHEEIGITVTEAEHWKSIDHTYPDKTVHLSLWWVHAYLGEPHAKENQQLRFASVAEMRALTLLEGNIGILDVLLAEVPGGLNNNAAKRI
ncbi:MAG TPA: NUDIX domain-containing protein [Gammaproteobacteria bacterium]|jgi:8-oxo-dGTP diphosphatase|nr:NUDIX domain-containing protein [Gammaproteobacteria bacterium]